MEDFRSARDDLMAPTVLTLRTLRRRHEIMLRGSSWGLGDLWDEGLSPLLLSAGFSQEQIDALILELAGEIELHEQLEAEREEKHVGAND